MGDGGGNVRGLANVLGDEFVDEIPVERDILAVERLDQLRLELFSSFVGNVAERR